MKKVMMVGLLLLFVASMGSAMIPVWPTDPQHGDPETAWAEGPEFPGRSWAMYFNYYVQCDPNCYEAQYQTLWAGQNIAVGEVGIGFDQGTNDLYIRFEVDPGWCITETHAAFGFELDDIPMTGSGNPKIGHFPYSGEHENCTTVVLYHIEIPNGECDFTGFFAAHAVVQSCTGGTQGHDHDIVTVPGQYTLAEPYPNPFNASATVSVSLPEASDLTVNVFSVTGQQVATIANGTYSAGTHQLHFNAANLASGVYFVQALVPGQMNEMRKVMLVR